MIVWLQGPVDERMMQLLRLCNRLLDKSVEARRRGLAWNAPVLVPVWPQIRMLQVRAGTGWRWRAGRDAASSGLAPPYSASGCSIPIVRKRTDCISLASHGAAFVIHT